MRAGQLSLEYIVILGVALALLIPGVLFFASYAKSDSGMSTNAQLNDIGLQALATVKSTYAHGINARQTAEFRFPESVTQIYVRDYEMVIVYDTPQGPSEAVFFSTINMSSSTADPCDVTSPNPDGNVTVAHPGLTRLRFTMSSSTIPTVCIDEPA